MNSNLDAVLKYIQSDTFEERLKSAKLIEKNKLYFARKTVFKIWDHINLAQQQYSVLKQSDDDYREKFQKSIALVREKLTKEMSAQLLTIVAIFTAVAFFVFGSISSLDNVFSNTNIPLLKAVIIDSVWGLCVINLIFVFLFCIAKMTKLNFKSSNKKDATIFQKYPIVWWSNLTILSIIVLCLWGYYLTKENIYFWFGEICKIHPMLSSILGFAIIFTIIIILFIGLLKVTKHTNDDEEKKRQ